MSKRSRRPGEGRRGQHRPNERNPDGNGPGERRPEPRSLRSGNANGGKQPHKPGGGKGNDSRNPGRGSDRVYHVTAGDAGKSLVGALRGWVADEPWSQIRRMVLGRRVQVNGNLCLDEGRRLKEGEVVKLFAHPLAVPPREADVKIRYCDTHLVVVEKPAGMTSMRHPEERDWPSRRKQRQPTLDESLPTILARLNRGSDRGKGKPPPVRPVHRLDRDTSGLMVFARSVIAERGLVHQFREHSIHRKYLAIVHGRVQTQTIESRLVRDRGDGRRGSTDLPDIGQLAVTHVRPVEYLGDYTLIECVLETGRTHQIRIHLSEQGNFVCGDKVYCQPLFKKPLRDRSGAPRLALHAAELGFTHPVTEETMHFKMPFPSDLAQFLERLRKERDRRVKDDEAG